MIELAVHMVVGLVTAVAVHEAGHWLAARALGGRDVHLGFDRGRLHVDASFADGRVRARIAFHLAGAFSNVAAAVVLAAAGAWIVAGMHALVAAVTLAPGAHSDGARALALFVRAPRR